MLVYNQLKRNTRCFVNKRLLSTLTEDDLKRAEQVIQEREQVLQANEIRLKRNREKRLQKYKETPLTFMKLQEFIELKGTENVPRGQFFQLIDIDKTRKLRNYDVYKSIPEGLSGEWKEDEIWHNKELSELMIRDEYLKINRKMVELENLEQVPDDWKALVLGGDRNSGKSMALNLAVIRARNSGWLALHVNDCREFVAFNSIGTWERGTKTAVPTVESKLRPGMFSQPLGIQKVLENFAKAHEDKLKTLPKKRTYDHNAYDYDDDNSLMTLIKRGTKSKAYAGDALYDLRMELGLVTEYPVLIAADQVNSLYWPVPFSAKGLWISPDKLLFSESFRFFDRNGRIRPEHKMKRGLLLGATTGKYGWPVPPKQIVEHHRDNGYYYFRPFDVRRGDIEKKPDWMPEAKWESRSEDINEIICEPYDDIEARSFIINLKRNEVITETKSYFQESQFQKLLTASGRNPVKLREALLSLAFILQTHTL